MHITSSTVLSWKNSPIATYSGHLVLICCHIFNLCDESVLQELKKINEESSLILSTNFPL